MGGIIVKPMKKSDMKIKQTLVAMMAVVMLSPASIALAQTGPIDKAYESSTCPSRPPESGP